MVLDAAEIVFKQQGVAASTLNDIAKMAGMTGGAIYWHFKDKCERVRAMCERSGTSAKPSSTTQTAREKIPA